MNILGFFQRLGRALQLPIAVLPVAALLLRFGQPDLLNVAFIPQAGGAIFDNLALIFAIGVASSWSKDSAGAAALAGAVGYFVLTKAMVTINPEINMGVLAGIITGLVGGAASNRWSDIKLPDFLSFFGGKRFVPIATGFFCLVLAAILSIPLSILLGLMCGSILNRAKGREMVTSYFIAYCMTGVYQLVVLYMMGPIIPILHNTLKLPRGFGIRNTVSLLQMRQSVDNALAVYVGGVKIPVLTLIIIALACLFIVWFRRTKLGQDMRAVGQDMNVARDAGINVDRTRLISIVMSTVFAGFGMIIYLQNMGNFPTYTAHTNVGMFCIAALLVGGASVEKASIGNVFLGVLLFHTMFIVAPAAGTKITGDSMIGEYFRVFVSYAVITVALVMYEAKKRKENRTLGQQLAIEQKAEEEGRTA